MLLRAGRCNADATCNRVRRPPRGSAMRAERREFRRRRHDALIWRIRSRIGARHEKARSGNHGAVPGTAGTGRRRRRPVRARKACDRMGRARERRQDAPTSTSTSPKGLDPFSSHGKMLEQGKADMYNACEWGNYCRVQDTQVGSRQVGRRGIVSYAAIVVRPDSPVFTAQQLAGKTVGVPFYFGTHYLALHLLEGFMARDQIKLCRTSNGSRPRFDAMMRGEIEATTLTEPYVTLAEKQRLPADLRGVLSRHRSGLRPRRRRDLRRVQPRGARGGAAHQRRQGAVPPLLHRLSQDEGRRDRGAQAARTCATAASWCAIRRRSRSTRCSAPTTG